jgi:preprotein translocase subunit SecG
MIVIIFLIIIILFIVLGVIFFHGKGTKLISGYNTASKWEKAKYDEKALCRFMGKLMFVLAGCWVIPTIGIFYNRENLIMFGTMLFIIVAVIAAIYANTGNRFKKK